MPRRRWAIHLFAIGIFLCLCLLLTWPLAAHFSTHVPGDGGDDPALAWNLWWVKYALVDLGANPFACDHMFYPLGINLAFYTLTVLNGCLSVPLQGIFGLITVSNLLLLSSFVLSAYGAFLLTREALRQEGPASRFEAGVRLAAALFAGLVYGFSSSKLFYASLGQFNIASSQWIPYYALMLLRMGRARRPLKPALLAGLFLGLQGWAEMTYATFLVVFTAVVMLARLPLRRPARTWLAWLGPYALAVGLGAASMLPMVLEMLPDMRAEGDFFVEGSGFAEEFSSDPLGFLMPTQLHPLLGGWVSRLGFPHDKAQHYFLGYSVLLLAGLGLALGRRRADVRLWGWSALTFLLLTLGPTLHVNGQSLGTPLPFRLFQALPFFKGNRYPSRYGVLLVLSLAVLAGVGLTMLLQRVRARRRGAAAPAAVGVALLFLFEQLSAPLPLSDLRVPPAYAALQEPGEYAVLDLPLAWRNGFRITGVMHPIFMYAQFYQTAHHQPVLGGNTSRNPERKFQYFTELPVLNSLVALESGRALSAEQAAQDRALAPQVLSYLGVRYVVLHRPTAGPALERYVEDTLPLEPVYADASYRVYRVQDGMAETTALFPDLPAGRLLLGEGWGEPAPAGALAQSERATLVLPAGAFGRTLILTLRAPGAQQVDVALGRCRLGRLELGPEWREYALLVPAACDDTPALILELRGAHAFAAAEGAWPVGQTGAAAPAQITVRSAGQEVGDFGHIYVAGVDRSPNQRGYNLVALEPATGAVQAAAFDTHLDASAGEAMAAFVADLAPGSLVAVAVADEASMNLSEAAVQALQSLGLAGDLRGHFRASHAAVGVKGAAPGSAAEAMSDTWPATVSIGEGATRPAVYFVLRAARLEPAP